MKSSTGRWVSGDDFFDREADLEILRRLIEDHNHVLLTGQRRMGKTSITREIARRLEADDWICLFCDVEDAKCPEDVIVEMAAAAQAIQSIGKRFTRGIRRLIRDRIKEINVLEFGIKMRAGIDAGNWKRLGELLLRDCADQKQRVLLVIDELPIFLKRILDKDQHAKRVDEFLSWLRGAIQRNGKDGPVLIVSGSIGLQPLVRRLGIPDRINHLYSYRLEPWEKEKCINCFKHLASSYGLSYEDGVAEAVYEALGIGIPHHVQSFFAHLRDFSVIQQLDQVRVQDVDTVYRTELLGPTGQIDLDHYRLRLKDALTEDGYIIALEILAEAAIQNVFTPTARKVLVRKYGRITEDPRERISEVLDVLVHDGYLVADGDGHRFHFRLLKEWWAVQFTGHYTPLDEDGSGNQSNEIAQ